MNNNIDIDRVLFQTFEKNEHGNDYIVGDLHGMYDLLMYHLKNSIKFNFNHDRLFIVGDLVDKGEQSVECLKLLKENWCYSILGNHDAMMIHSYYQNNYSSNLLGENEKKYLSYQENDWLNTYGDWFDVLFEEDQKELIKIALSMPLFIQIKTKQNKLIGLCHADYVYDDWNYIHQLIGDYYHIIDTIKSNIDSGVVEKEYMQQLLEYKTYVLPREFESFLWSRKKFGDENIFDKNNQINNIDKVIVGHSITMSKKHKLITDGLTKKDKPIFDRPFYIGNCLYLDTGACIHYVNNQKIARINKIIHEINSHINQNNSVQMEESYKKIFQLQRMSELSSLSFYDVSNDKIISCTNKLNA